MIFKKAPIFICILFVCSSVFSEVAQENPNAIWGYDSDDGPNEWCHIMPNTQCCGPHESPINIIPRSVKPIDSELTLINYDKVPEEITMTNNGHTVVLQQKNIEKLPKLNFRGEKYFLESFHFHWGKNDGEGSEHSINGLKYPMEMHLVHVNVKYESSAEAENHNGGLAVLGVLFEISYFDNNNFNALVNSLHKVKQENDTVILEDNFSMSSLLPFILTTAYNYNGSLTTPPCSQTVEWFILTNAVLISEEQINQFRQLTTERFIPNSDHWVEEELADNYRDLSPLNGRQVDLCKVRIDEDFEWFFWK